MGKILKILRANHKELWANKDNLQSLLLGLVFLIFSLLVQRAADVYIVSLKVTAASDVLLSNLPTVDLDVLIIWGTILLPFIALAFVIHKPKYLNFSLKSLALFIIIRSFLISLTHLGADPNQLILNKNDFGFGLYNLLYNTNNDFFFSGHTGMPFLAALVFWPNKSWRYFFMVMSVVLGGSLLLAHIHYSIDVFAAPFMTYSIFAISKKFFSKDYELSRHVSAGDKTN